MKLMWAKISQFCAKFDDTTEQPMRKIKAKIRLEGPQKWIHSLILILTFCYYNNLYEPAHMLYQLNTTPDKN